MRYRLQGVALYSIPPLLPPVSNAFGGMVQGNGIRVKGTGWVERKRLNSRAEIKKGEEQNASLLFCCCACFLSRINGSSQDAFEPTGEGDGFQGFGKVGGKPRFDRLFAQFGGVESGNSNAGDVRRGRECLN
jgi:hypothetical protein